MSYFVQHRSERSKLLLGDGVVVLLSPRSMSSSRYTFEYINTRRALKKYEGRSTHSLGFIGTSSI